MIMSLSPGGNSYTTRRAQGGVQAVAESGRRKKQTRKCSAVGIYGRGVEGRGEEVKTIKVYEQLSGQTTLSLGGRATLTR